MHRSSRTTKTFWKTIELVQIDWETFAYQQQYRVEKKTQKKKRYKQGLGIGLGLTTIATEDHRLVPIEETVSNKQELVEQLNS